MISPTALSSNLSHEGAAVVAHLAIIFCSPCLSADRTVWLEHAYPRALAVGSGTFCVHIPFALLSDPKGKQCLSKGFQWKQCLRLQHAAWKDAFDGLGHGLH